MKASVASGITKDKNSVEAVVSEEGKTESHKIAKKTTQKTSKKSTVKPIEKIVEKPVDKILEKQDDQEDVIKAIDTSGTLEKDTPVVAKENAKRTYTKRTATGKTTKKTATAKAAKSSKSTKTTKAASTKSVAEKTTAKADKAEKKVPKARKLKKEFYFQYLGNQIDEDALLNKVILDCKGQSIEVKEIKLYLKPEDNTCYYVANGNIAGKVELY